MSIALHTAQTAAQTSSWTSSLYAYVARLDPRRSSRARLQVERSSQGSNLSHMHRTRRGGTLDRGTGFYKEERQKLKMPHLVETGKCVGTRSCRLRWYQVTQECGQGQG